MPFPDSERVIYNKNPLIQVICQFRFPAILRIDSELPAEFQERIRDQYPIFREKPIGSGSIPQEIIQQLPPAIVNSMIGEGNKAYEFATDGDFWIVSLTRDFLALTSNQYVRWEQFKKYLQEPLTALIDIYVPAFFSRIGLRYRNVIDRLDLGLVDATWAELLNPYIAGELAATDVGNLGGEILDVTRVTHIQLGERDQVRVQHGLVTDDSGETRYLIDNDFFTNERTEVSDGLARLDHFNSENRKLFQWCITERLHTAMEPR
jgi:uncharacterized protein (TIGR04255 family)